MIGRLPVNIHSGSTASPGTQILAFKASSLSDNNPELPIRIQSLIIILPTAGSGTISIDMNEYPLQKHEMILLQPSSYISGYDLSPDFEADIFVCKEDDISTLFPSDALPDISRLLTFHRANPVVPASPIKWEILRSYFNFLTTILDAPPSPLRFPKERLLFASAIAEIIDMETSEATTPNYGYSRKEWLMAQFVETVSLNFKKERQVSFYAKELGITPKHLSTVVKSMSGKTAGEWIESFVIMEAKVLLASVELPVQEIAAILHFPNQSFFGKYFKHISGLSPTKFRSQLS